MTAQPHDFAPGGAAESAKSLRAVRAALVVPQDREAFDAGLKAVLDQVRVNLDLGVLNDFVHRWWISACDSAHDPEGRRRMHACAGQIAAGEVVPAGRPWRELLTERENGRQVYRLDLDPVAEEQINAVPEGALRPLAELFTLLETAPWSGQPFNPANRRGDMLTPPSANAGLSPTLSSKNTARYAYSALNGRDRYSVTSGDR